MSLITKDEQSRLGQAVAASRAAPVGCHSVIEAGAEVGTRTIIGPLVSIEALAVVGDDCVIESGTHICAGTTIEDGVHLGSHVAFARSPQGEPGAAVVRRGAWVGAHAVIGAGVVIGAKAVVRPGSAVARSVPPGAIVEGNPAQIVGYVDTAQGPAGTVAAPPMRQRAAAEATPVRGVTVHHFPVIPDLRGSLTVGEFERQIPFTPKRYFIVFGVPSREIRGEHAHHLCHQFLICVRGSCSVVADDGAHKVEVTLDAPDRGLYLPPKTWGIQYKYSADAMLLVFASDYYDGSDYIRDYAEFIAHTAAA